MSNTQLVAKPRVGDTAARAATEAFEKGGSPRAQIDAARNASGQKLGYLPHQSSREIQRRAKRLAAKG